jgi:hypothetical protein
MKTLIGLIATIPSLLIVAPGNGQIKNAKTITVNVYGNCGTCKRNIETAANTKKVSAAEWNENNSTAVLIYDSTKTTADAILKKIALAGYDNQSYLAPDVAYSKLDLCCQYERKKISKLTAQHSGEANMKPDMTAMSSQDINKQAAQTKNENILSAVYLAYFGIKDALIKGEGNAASAKAKELFKAVDAVPMDKLSASQHTIWMKHMKDISYNAEHIKSTTETEHQREHFTKLSIAMYEVMKIIKADYPIYYDHCPMYNSGKGGDWLSKESDIKNPYYGSQMLSCGSTKEVIK